MKTQLVVSPQNKVHHEFWRLYFNTPKWSFNPCVLYHCPGHLHRPIYLKQTITLKCITSLLHPLKLQIFPGKNEPDGECLESNIVTLMNPLRAIWAHLDLAPTGFIELYKCLDRGCSFTFSPLCAVISLQMKWHNNCGSGSSASFRKPFLSIMRSIVPRPVISARRCCLQMKTLWIITCVYVWVCVLTSLGWRFRNLRALL